MEMKKIKPNKLFRAYIFVSRCSTDDQKNVDDYVKRVLSTEEHNSFRPLQESASENLLLVHQTKDQQRLMQLYGNEIALLDATHKTTKYALPLFLVVVLTNAGYQVVGSFLVSKETTEAIQEALSKLAEWNPLWKPVYWMTDCCAAEQNAVEGIFPGKLQKDQV